MKEKLRIFINNNLEVKKRSFIFKTAKLNKEDSCVFEEVVYGDISNFINSNKDENKFQSLLFKYIDDRDLKDSDVYNKVHIDRRLFSKIRSNSNYHPSKDTVILLGLALKLNLDEMLDLLNSASYSLPKNNYFDLIIRFCFIEGIYNLKDVNDLLDTYNCKLFNY